MTPHTVLRLRASRTADVLVVAGLYVLFADAAWALGSLPGKVSPVWPAAGLAVGALLLRGRHTLVGVFLGELLANHLSGTPVLVASGMGLGNVAEAVLFAHLLRTVPGEDRLRRVGTTALFVGAAVLATVVGAAVGVGCLLAGGVVPAAGGVHAATVWWAGDALGILTVTPVLLAWHASGHLRPRPVTVVEATLCLAGTSVVTVWAFAQPMVRPYLVFPFVMWAALRWRQRGASGATLLIATLGVLALIGHQGRGLAFDQFQDPVWVLDFFLGVVAVTGLVLAAVVSERDTALAWLSRSNAVLEERVALRTEALDLERGRLAESQALGRLGSWDWDVVHDTMSWSDELYGLLGVTPEDYDGTFRGFRRLVHPDDRELVHDALMTAYRDKARYDVTHRVVHGDGTVHWLRSRGRALLDGTGRVDRMAGTAQDVTTATELHHELQRQADHDQLTGLPNRAFLHRHLTELLNAPQRRHAERGGLAQDPLAVIFLDLDRFKWINDSLGHAAGDAVLLEVAERLTTNVRDNSLVARFGGDEFVVVCPGLTDALEAEQVAARVLEVLAAPHAVDGHEHRLSASIGVAVSGPGTSAEELLRDADTAMYQAKSRGGGAVTLFDEGLAASVRARFDTAQLLRAALEERQISPHYQAIVELSTGRVVGVEALARWEHPRLGMIPADQFIPVAEQSGAIVQLGAQMLQQGCHDVASWNTQRHTQPALHLAVNVSARQLAAPGLVDVVADALAASGLPPQLLWLELTETALVEDVEITSTLMEQLRELGVSLSVDDFGTGYSSLVYLRRYPVTSLKVDRSFIAGTPSQPDDVAIVTNVIDLAHGLGLSAVAEGVETEEQRALLQAAGCEYAQGYLWGKPQSAAAFLRWLAAREAVARAGVPLPRIALPTPARSTG